MGNHIVPDPALEAKALAGEIEGTEKQVIDGTNTEGQPRELHHFKAKKLLVKGKAGNKTPASPEEAQRFKDRKKNK